MKDKKKNSKLISGCAAGIDSANCTKCNDRHRCKAKIQCDRNVYECNWGR